MFSKYYLNVKKISKNQNNELNNSYFKVEYLENLSSAINIKQFFLALVIKTQNMQWLTQNHYLCFICSSRHKRISLFVRSHCKFISFFLKRVILTFFFKLTIYLIVKFENFRDYEKAFTSSVHVSIYLHSKIIFIHKILFRIQIEFYRKI